MELAVDRKRLQKRLAVTDKELAKAAREID